MEDFDGLDLLAEGHELDILLLVNVVEDELLVVVGDLLGHVVKNADFVLLSHLLLPAILVLGVLDLLGEQLVVEAIQNELPELVDMMVFQRDSDRKSVV